MTDPENLPVDDSQREESEDQQSQKDIHSNGLTGKEPGTGNKEPETEQLLRASRASEASFTLDPDRGIA